MRVAIASDHAGFHYKEAIKKRLIEFDHEVSDFGINSSNPRVYPTSITMRTCCRLGNG